MKSQNKILREGNVQYYSTSQRIYFVTVRQNYTYRDTPCNRLLYYIIGNGKHMKSIHRLKKVNKTLFDQKLKEVKMYDMQQDFISKKNR